MDVERKLILMNSTGESQLLYIEPWGEEYPVPGNATLVIIGRGPEAGSCITVDLGPSSVAIAAWDGSVLAVYCDDCELGDWRKRPPVPVF
jgi:hypothetical protein